MTVKEARTVFAGRPRFGDPRSIEARQVFEQVQEARHVIEADIERRGKAGQVRHYTGKLTNFSPDVIDAAYQELGL